MKYVAPLERDGHSSHSIIVERIQPNSRVLEFGPAQGQMTQYLKEALNCRVSIVEMDPEGCANAGQFAEKAICCDIEDYSWEEALRGQLFDYIVFADVIEHLRRPEEALRLAARLLAPDGTMIISTPNVAHNSVLLDLFNNKFVYHDFGILDSTHVKLFTYHSLEALFQSLRLFPIGRYATYSEVGENEFDNSYNSANGVSPFVWKTRPYGNVLQFIYCLKKDYQKSGNIENHVKKYGRLYTGCCYFGCNGHYNEQETSVFEYTFDSPKQCVQVTIPPQYADCGSFRFDPLAYPAVITVHSAYGLAQGEKVPIDCFFPNADYQLLDQYYFLHNDSQIHIETHGQKIEALVFEMTFEDIENRDAIQRRVDALSAQAQIMSEKALAEKALMQEKLDRLKAEMALTQEERRR